MVQLDLDQQFFTGITDSQPLIIAGPCSAESEEQVIAIARALHEMGIQVFRAGLWKPRTHPDSFEGVGSKGLQWLSRVKKETGMMVTVEVANVKHLYQAIKFGVDILWIGARTTSDPFAVQEIADSLQGMDIPVMVKNPINPDIELWIGALERLNKAGITRLSAIHRGFSLYHPSEYRNDPQWQIPIELRRRIPNIPIITDPSHICGKRSLLQEVSQKAMDLHFDGLIVEVHNNPDSARSDREQQLTPSDFQKMISALSIRKEKSNDIEFVTELDELRREIDKIDDELLSLFNRRMKVSEKIGLSKKQQNVAIYQPTRWSEILEKRKEKGMRLGLSTAFIEEMFRVVHEESINVQNRIMNPEIK